MFLCQRFLWAEACNSQFIGTFASYFSWKMTYLVDLETPNAFLFSYVFKTSQSAMSAFWGAEIIHLSSATCHDLFRERHFVAKHRSVKYACTSTPCTCAFSLINHVITVFVKIKQKKQSQKNTALSALSFPTVLRYH